MSEWKKEESRQRLVKDLKATLQECEGLGHLAEAVERWCFSSSDTEKEYLGKLESFLIERSDLGSAGHHNCEICSFLRRVSTHDWNILSQIEI